MVCTFLPRLARGEDDTLEETRRKSFLPHWFALMCVEMVIALVWSIGWPTNTGTLAVDIMFLSTAGGIVFVLTTKTFPLWTNELIFALHTVCIIVLDWTNSAAMEETWQFVIIVTDALLLVGCRQFMVAVVSGVTVMWLVVRTSEETFRFGLMDMVQLTQHESAGCRLPPQTIGHAKAIHRLISRLLVFILDLAFTRGFAIGMHLKQEKLKQTVVLARSIAEALVRFDLVEARKLVEEEKHVDDDLALAFNMLIDNLKVYRPYLPQALFNNSSNMSDASTVLLPNMNQEPPVGKVAVVFTDVQDSTLLWESSPEDMSMALKLHSRAIRECIQFYEGYEVKTIGDAFMIAFQDLLPAVRFCLHAQDLLLHEDWPVGLQGVKSYEKVMIGDTLLWWGLRVRMGLHYGAAALEMNPITRRGDYFGPTVNKASRVESATSGGMVGVTREIMGMLSMEDIGFPVALGPFVKDMKGIGREEVYALVPSELAARKSWMQTKRNSRKSSMAPSWGAPQDKLFDAKTPFKRHSTIGTLCIVRVLLDDGQCSMLGGILEVLTDSSDRSEGLVMAMMGTQVCISWNGSGLPCPCHTTQAVRFARNVSIVAGEHVAFGMCSGPMSHLAIGSGRYRFVVSVGWLEMVAQRLCAISQSLSKTILCASVPGYPSPHDDVSVAHYLEHIFDILVMGTTEIIPVYVCSEYLDEDPSVWGTLEQKSNTSVVVEAMVNPIGGLRMDRILKGYIVPDDRSPVSSSNRSTPSGDDEKLFSPC